MIHNFYPGPSTLHPHFEEAVKSAISSGILAMNHRSPAFASLYQNCFETLQEKWKIPSDFRLLFVSSATETWEILAQSLIVDAPSLHLFNGAFGEKSFTVAQQLTNKAHALPFGFDEQLPVEKVNDYPFIHLCQNETSNGTAVSNKKLKTLREKHPKAIISVDATSSLGGVYLDFSCADVWYGSVQKCLGLPSGMGVILINERAIEVVKQKQVQRHYNDLLNLVTNAEKWQTTHTPNILNIHALAFTQNKTSSIQTIEKQLIVRKEEFINQLPEHLFLSSTDQTQSTTVFSIQTNNPKKLIDEAAKKHFILGKGYGKWLENTFRIANFPSASDDSFSQLLEFLQA